MRALISFFKEPEEIGLSSAAPPDRPGVEKPSAGEPQYFVQLLEFLKRRKEAGAESDGLAEESEEASRQGALVEA